MKIVNPIFAAILLFLLLCNDASAGVVQWRNRVPAGEANPNNTGSYTNTIEIGNGGTTGYDSGLDVDLVHIAQHGHIQGLNRNDCMMID
jgi:hypothetical protein